MQGTADRHTLRIDIQTFDRGVFMDCIVWLNPFFKDHVLPDDAYILCST